MSSAHPKLLGLGKYFPVFPLSGALLLPGGKLPLNIFEKRYLALVEDALGAGRLFGMVQPERQAGAGEDGPPLYQVGCLGRIASFSETDDGRYLITLLGLSRFRITEETSPKRGYRRVSADFAAFAADLADSPEEPGFDRPVLLAALRGYFSHRGFEANWDAINLMKDNDLVVTLCMVCPFDPAEKQALLEAPLPSDRARTLLTLLQIDMHAPPSDDAGEPKSRGRAS